MVSNAMRIHVDIVSAEGAIFSGLVLNASFPAVMGEIGVLPRHAPLITCLKPGEVRILTAADKHEYIYVDGGMLEVLPHGVTVLADVAMRSEKIDETAALAAKKRAEDRLNDSNSPRNFDQAKLELMKAVAQLKTYQDGCKKSKPLKMTRD